MLSTNPGVLKQVVSRAVPAKISNAKTWIICRPTADWPVVKLPWRCELAKLQLLKKQKGRGKLLPDPCHLSTKRADDLNCVSSNNERRDKHKQKKILISVKSTSMSNAENGSIHTASGRKYICGHKQKRPISACEHNSNSPLVGGLSSGGGMIPFPFPRSRSVQQRPELS